MKKAFCTGTLAVSLLLGAARAADLFLNTDTATGFLLSGSVWTRYWLMAPVVILAWLAGLYVPRKLALRAAAGCGRVDERREFCVCAAGLLQ